MNPEDEEPREGYTDDEGPVEEEHGYCEDCAGSGEGAADGTTCRTCRGSGETRGWL